MKIEPFATFLQIESGDESNVSSECAYLFFVCFKFEFRRIFNVSVVLSIGLQVLGYRAEYVIFSIEGGMNRLKNKLKSWLLAGDLCQNVV